MAFSLHGIRMLYQPFVKRAYAVEARSSLKHVCDIPIILWTCHSAEFQKAVPTLATVWLLFDVDLKLRNRPVKHVQHYENLFPVRRREWSNFR
jgi:hypothetical protein